MLDFLTILYGVCALLLTLYTSGQLILLIVYWLHRHERPALPVITDWPTVTVQLPIYNERHVVVRLLEAVSRLDYPRDKLTVQVLDDSTDDTSQLVALYVAQLQRRGLNIQHVQRPERTGYKAGALDYGISITDSELLAVLDADFVPPPDFLRLTVPHMAADPGLGILQTRWGHLNPFENLLTRAQALSVDAHFVIEQTARNRAGWLLTFNGTGGLWRTQCIADAGGWSADTLTEDLDLSYRAQMAGWRYLFLPDVSVPGELPPQIQAYKQQQERWAKGNTQCLIKLFRPVWSGRLTLVQRIMAMQHLCQYLPHPLMLTLLLLTPPLMITGALKNLPLAPMGLVGLAPPLLYAIGQRILYPDWKRRMLVFPVLMMLGTGIIWNNTKAVASALFGEPGEFRRTPKFVQGWQASTYALSTNGSWVELFIALYALWGAWLALQFEPALVPYMSLYSIALGTITIWERLDSWNLRRRGNMAIRPTPPITGDRHP
jgi:cellulose synthase/poly-beta-1,6-N-acetylglucosamine synthase-like glycosyltransferase